MKEEAMKKINTIGKAGSIVTLIIKIVLTISLVGMLLATVVSFALPKDLFSMKIASTIEVKSAPLNGLINGLTNLDELLSETSDEANVELNDINYQITHSSLDNNVLTVSLDQKEPAVITKPMIARALIIVDIAIFLSIICATTIRKLCKAFKECATPFCEEVILNMRKVAISLIPWCVFSVISNNVFDSLMKGTNDINIGVNLGVVAAVIIIFGLTYVFKYGAVLQQESDETI